MVIVEFDRTNLTDSEAQIVEGFAKMLGTMYLVLSKRIDVVEGLSDTNDNSGLGVLAGMVNESMPDLHLRIRDPRKK